MNKQCCEKCDGIGGIGVDIIRPLFRKCGNLDCPCHLLKEQEIKEVSKLTMCRFCKSGFFPEDLPKNCPECGRPFEVAEEESNCPYCIQGVVKAGFICDKHFKTVTLNKNFPPTKEVKQEESTNWEDFDEKVKKGYFSMNGLGVDWDKVKVYFSKQKQEYREEVVKIVEEARQLPPSSRNIVLDFIINKLNK